MSTLKVDLCKKEKRIELVQQFYNAIELKRQAVGFKFLYSKEEFDEADAKALTGCLPYCVMVKAAASGGCLKATKECFGCYGGAVALGVSDPDKDVYPDKEPGYYTSGKPGFLDMKIYNSLEIAKKSAEAIVICKKRAYGVMLKPLDKLTVDPDIVIIVTNAFNAMRIIQGYSYEFGTYSQFRMAGNQAMCSELTAYPFTTNEINVTLMCSGTRQNSHWEKDELGIGLPFSKFEALVHGIYSTINPLERDDEKRRIEKNMKETKLENIQIEYGKNYDTGCYQFGKVK